jgi:hypothetical protein
MTGKNMKNERLNILVTDYILNAIDGESYGIELNTIPEKLQFLNNTFKKEYCFSANIRFYGSIQNVLKNWIMGLPSCFNIDFENYKIIELAVKWGSIPVNYSEKEADKILYNWFNFIAAKTLMMFTKYHIK